MESVINWVAAMIQDGHTPTEIRVADPWREALIDAGNDVALMGPVRPGNESVIEFVTSNGSYFATLVN